MSSVSRYEILLIQTLGACVSSTTVLAEYAHVLSTRCRKWIKKFIEAVVIMAFKMNFLAFKSIMKFVENI